MKRGTVTTKRQPAPAGGDVSAETADVLIAIGARIRDLRLEKGFTLQGLNELTGLSPSMLSLVERGKTSPSIGTLMVICSTLGVHMGDLMAANPQGALDPVSRAGAQTTFETSRGVVRRVLRDDRARGIEIAINEYARETGNSTVAVQHAGYEYGVILEGELTVELDGTAYLLKTGDAISYQSARPHRIWNHGRARARALWVNLERS